jgi:hypothetical protein
LAATSSQGGSREGRRDAGVSLVGLLVALAIVIIGAWTLVTALSSSLQHMRARELRDDLANIREGIRSDFDCFQSLGAPPDSSLPLTCGSFGAVPILRKDGSVLTSGTVGSWTIQAGCVDDRILFTAMKPGNEPSTGQPWASSPLLRAPDGTLDLFRGTSSFCSAYFRTPLPAFHCPPGQIIEAVDIDSGFIRCTPGRAYGGHYTTWQAHPITSVMNYPCMFANVLTGACSCPDGYTAEKVNEYKSQCQRSATVPTSKSTATCSFYGSDNPSHWVNGVYYGMIQYACLR